MDASTAFVGDAEEDEQEQAGEGFAFMQSGSHLHGHYDGGVADADWFGAFFDV